VEGLGRGIDGVNGKGETPAKSAMGAPPFFARSATPLALAVAALFSPLRAAEPKGKSPAAPPAQPAPAKCVVCDVGPLVGLVRAHRYGQVCDDCYPLDSRCHACGLPVKSGGGRSQDGRVFCKFDFPNVVLKQEEARKIYDETVLDLRRVLGSIIDLRFTNVNVQLFDVDYWNHRDGKPVPGVMRRAGFSISTQAGSHYTHTVLLLSGQTRADTSATCAHEYTHLWLNENVPDTRFIEAPTIEAICEFVAHKLAGARRDTNLQARIAASTYTSGRITKLVEAEQRHGIDAILDWARRGTNEAVDDRALAGFASKSAAPAAPTTPVAGAGKTAPAANGGAPTLQLVGLVYNPKRRAAQINEHLFEVDEEKRMLVGERVLAVRCVDIRTNAVVLSLDGSTNHVTLWRVGR
jgi:hypothetical protein